MINSDFAALWSDLHPQLGLMAAEATELRAAVSDSSAAETVEDLHERLIRTRQAQDRLEALLADLGRLRSRARKAMAQAQDAYEDAWRTTMQKTHTGEYASAKEKDATYDVGALDEKVALRKARNREMDVNEVYEYVRLKWQGTDSSRRDISDRIRLISVAGYLEN